MIGNLQNNFSAFEPHFNFVDRVINSEVMA